MNALEKILKKLTSQERERVAEIITRLTDGKTENLDIKKLKGRDDIFRIRRGRIRIIYRRSADGKIFILTIERRKEDTYKF